MANMDSLPEEYREAPWRNVRCSCVFFLSLYNSDILVAKSSGQGAFGREDASNFLGEDFVCDLTFNPAWDNFI